MLKTLPAFAATLAWIVAACSPAPPAAGPTPVQATAMPATIPAATLSATSAASPAATATPLPVQTPPSAATPTELKYRVLDQFPNFFFCDPDFYPVARANEADLARQRFSELQANAEEFQAILAHNGLSGLTTFTDEQKLLIYREHKKLAAIQWEPAGGGAYRFQLQIKESNKQGFVVKGSIDSQGSIAVRQRDPSFPTCPICLAAGTRIDTPRGPVAVEDLRAGDTVWTADATGARLAARLLKTARAATPAGHQMAHVVLDDGRQLWASPGHPTADGRALGDLRPGDRLDGARVVRLERAAYDRPATYDVLPAGETGWYWASGILMASTLGGVRSVGP